MYGEIMALLTNLSFALSFVLARKIEKEATPIFQNTIRAIVGCLTFLIICISLGIFLTVFSLPINVVMTLILSILFTVILGDTIYLYSQKVLGPPKALAITTTTPFFTILFAIIFLGYSITIQMIISGVLISMGVIIITTIETNNQDKKNNTNNNNYNNLIEKRISKTLIGTLLALLTAIFWAVGIALTDYSINQVDSLLSLGILSTLIAMFVRFLFASLTLSIITLLESKKTPIPRNRNTWYLLIISAFLSYSIGSIFFGEAVHYVGASIMSLISTALPLFTIPLSYIINKEKISKRGLLGIVIILIGVILTLF
ncbi:MAG: EamA family transporter [Candidatus Thorarchaeota archaeon]